MSQYTLKKSQTARPLLFLMVLASDHVTGATGLSPTVTLSKNGAAFASPAGAVTELANGWYQVAGNATDTNTGGPLLLHATAATADPNDTVFEVDALDPDDAFALFKEDWTGVTGEASHSMLNALRFLRNRWTLISGTLSVYKEDNATLAWSETISTTPGAAPVTSTSG